jgi:hypothetical protein
MQEREDRTLLAQKYLKELKKEDSSKAAAASQSAPKGSRHDSKYLRAEGVRDKQVSVCSMPTYAHVCSRMLTYAVSKYLRAEGLRDKQVCVCVRASCVRVRACV